jgi:hypothetical protein
MLRLARVSNQVNDVSERYRIPERLYNAGQSARRGAEAAYRAALNHPKTSIGGLIVAAGLVAGALWYLFGTWQRPLQRRSTPTRVRSVSERRKRARNARAAAAH